MSERCTTSVWGLDTLFATGCWPFAEKMALATGKQQGQHKCNMNRKCYQVYNESSHCWITVVSHHFTSVSISGSKTQFLEGKWRQGLQEIHTCDICEVAFSTFCHLLTGSVVTSQFSPALLSHFAKVDFPTAEVSKRHIAIWQQSS